MIYGHFVLGIFFPFGMFGPRKNLATLVTAVSNNRRPDGALRFMA
jgi:hypothetical protein